MNIPNSISNFLALYKGYLNGGAWDILFRLAREEDISLFELAKLLVNAGIDFKFSNKYQTGDLASIFNNISLGKLIEVADDLNDENIEGGYRLSKIKGNFYVIADFYGPLENESQYMSLRDFRDKLYRDVIMSLQRGYTIYYDVLFLNRIDAHNDPLINDIMLSKSIDPSILPKESSWKSVENLY